MCKTQLLLAPLICAGLLIEKTQRGRRLELPLATTHRARSMSLRPKKLRARLAERRVQIHAGESRFMNAIRECESSVSEDLAEEIKARRGRRERRSRYVDWETARRRIYR